MTLTNTDEDIDMYFADLSDTSEDELTDQFISETIMIFGGLIWLLDSKTEIAFKSYNICMYVHMYIQ